jgi:SAM-dependent methyltransferase
MSRFESDWRARFERYAHLYTDEAQISGWSAEGLRRRIELFQRLIRPPASGSPATALELGCGAGTYVRWLAGLGYQTVGLDYSLATLGRAVAADSGGKGCYLAGEAYALPCRSRSVDLVVSIGVLQALSEPRRAIAEIARVLRPGGLLLIEVLNSRATVAKARRAYQRLKGVPPRVATYDPGQVADWLSEHGLGVQHEAALCLPPRQLPGLGRLLQAGFVETAVNRLPALSRALAHAVWLVCRAPEARS